VGDKTVTPEELQAWVEAGRRMVDHPKAVEMRMYYGVTAERTHYLCQYRGQALAEVVDMPNAEGRVPDGVYALFAAVRERGERLRKEVGA
jgi:hypothetical protein